MNAKGEVFYVVPVPEKELSIFQVDKLKIFCNMLNIIPNQTSKEEKKEKKAVKKASKLSRLVSKKVAPRKSENSRQKGEEA